MGKNKKFSNKSKAPSLAGPNALPIFVIVMIALLVGIALIPFPKKDLNCRDHMTVDQYPPPLEFALNPQTLDKVLAGYPGTDPGDHFTWVLGVLQESGIPNAVESIEYLQMHEGQVAFIFQSLGKGTMGLVRPEGDKVALYINLDVLGKQPSGWNSFLLFLTIVHERVHVEQYLVEGPELAEAEEISLAEAYQRIYNRHAVDGESYICWEMEAFAYETAFFQQMQSVGLVNIPTVFDDYLDQMKKLNWNWKSSEWSEFIVELSTHYERGATDVPQ